MRSGSAGVVLVLVASLALSSCAANLVVGGPNWPPCFRENDDRMDEIDEIEEKYPATYAWLRRVDALCEAWSR